MKKLALVVLLAMSALASSQAFAAKYGTAGCGIGALVFEDKPGKIQILAATLNNVISPQTSAITSGTSNCYDDASTASLMYIAVNEQALRKDISRGNGESLAGLFKIMQCSNGDALGASLQKNYGTIFGGEKVSAEQINQNIKNTIKSDSQLSNSCSAVI